MKNKFNVVISLFMMVIFVQLSIAQEKTISGVVSDVSGIPLPGVNVLIKGTAKGAQTDFDGKYTISANTGSTLVFSYVGNKTQEVVVGSSNSINVTLQEDTESLDEVVVTAQGIKREKKALGYSVKEVKNEQLEQRAEGDVARVLNGKSAGLQITQQSGLSGSGTNIVIRGQNSFSASNQALFIVDGVPFSTATNSSGRGGDRNDLVNGNSGSSRFLDLDPNSIESVSVLKGLAASTLYGSEGRNGVVLITTKAGAAGNAKKKTEITVATSYFSNEIASLPDYQNEYGNGFDQAFGWFFSNWGPSFSEGGVAGFGGQDAINGENSGRSGFLEHPFSTASRATGIPQAFPEFADALYEWRPYDSVKNFFQTGSAINASINVRGSSNDGNISYNVNYGHLDDKGFTPGNTLRRNTLGVGGRAKLSNKFTASGVLNLALTNFVSPPVALSLGNGATGSGSSIFGDLWFTPRSIDIQGIPFQNPITGGSVYYRQNNSIQHPLWTLNNAQTSQDVNRIFGNTSLNYELNDNINVLYRVGIDIYNENNVNYQNKGGVNTISGDVRLASGVYETWNNRNTIFDHSLIISGSYDINDDFGANFTVGATSRREIFDQNGTSSDGQQVFGFLRHVNFLNQNEIQNSLERNIVGIYAQGEFDYKNYIFATIAGRNDWVSNFASANRSVFYPSASVSFLPTAAIDGLKSDALNYLKIRAGIGTSANFGDIGFPVAQTLSIDTQDARFNSNTVVTNSIPDLIPNPDLKPELLTEIEAGIEARLWKNRINLDLSLYNRSTKDLIINQPLDPATGGTNTTTNIGEIVNRGIELDLGFKIIKNENPSGLTWNANLNFTTYESEVTDLGLNTDLVVYSGFSNLGNAAIPGQPLGVLFGSRIRRDANDNLVVGGDGRYLRDTEDGIIGDPNPDWVSNLSTSVSYKNFTLGVQINYTKGGDVYSSTISTLLGRGLTTDTLNREDTFILPGVDENGNANRVQINNSDYFFGNVLFGPSELQVYDATTIRLQEASLAYKLPAKILEKTPFGSLSFTISGSNLWYNAINTPDGANFDPNTSGTGVGNGFGFDFINGPSSRRYGFSLKATF